MRVNLLTTKNKAMAALSGSVMAGTKENGTTTSSTVKENQASTELLRKEFGLIVSSLKIHVDNKLI